MPGWGPRDRPSRLRCDRDRRAVMGRGRGVPIGPQQHPGYGAQPPPRMIGSTIDALRQEDQTRRPNPSSQPPPSSTRNPSSHAPPPQSGSARSGDRYAHFPAHIRNHPRFPEAEYAVAMVEQYGGEDPRAAPYQAIVKSIIDEINAEHAERRSASGAWVAEVRRREVRSNIRRDMRRDIGRGKTREDVRGDGTEKG
jgi:hypothetical protein